MHIFPQPKKLDFNKAKFSLSNPINCAFQAFSSLLLPILEKEINIKINNNITCKQKISFNLDKDIPFEGYKINIDDLNIQIKASSDNGIYYAIKTLKQLVNKNYIEGAIIEDYPSLKIRGVMLDISRAKVPNIKTLKQLVDLFSDLKYNHLELYVEGFSYEYKSFPNVLSEHNYITLNDYKVLETYANEHFIDLVPNQNGFGHMTKWLARDEYKSLAECEQGFFIWGSHRLPSTLDPTNIKSYELVKKMYQDMLPHFKSKYFNMNFDEPYELGYGKSKKICDETSKQEVFINYLMPLYQVVKDYQKTPMIWGDFLINHPDALTKLPKDLIFIDWGYNLDYDFSNHAKLLKSKNVNFMLAPGTSTWSTITGRFEDMKATIINSAQAALDNQGLGILVTDWGDCGHLQYLPFSYLGFIMGGIYSWNPYQEYKLDDFINKLSSYLNKPIFAKILYELACYTSLEGDYRSYGSRLFSSILWAEHAYREENPTNFFIEKMQSNLIDEKSQKALYNFFTDIEHQLYYEEDGLIKAEIKNSINLLLVLLSINQKLTNYQKNSTNEVSNFDRDILILETYLKEHFRLWKFRNLEAGYVESASHINWLINMLKDLS